MAEDRTPAPSAVPSVSVVLPIYNVEQWLAECLDSLVAQTFSDFEIVVVDDGSPDGSRQVAEEYARSEPRIRIIERENGGLGAARNTGIRHAVGEYLTFVDSDDVVPAEALANLVAAAREDSADLVTGAVERYDGSDVWAPDWVERVHGERRSAIRLGDHLDLVRNLYTWNKLFRRDFWDRCGLWFREGVAYEDQPIVTQLFVRAERITVIPDVVYRYRVRPDRSSISQQVGTMRDLEDRIAAWEATREALRGDPPAVYDAWLLTLMTTHFHWYFGALDEVSDDYWRRLHASVVDFLAGASAELWTATPPQRRVLLELVRLGRREGASTFVAAGGRNLVRWPAERTRGGLLVDLPFRGDPELPDELFLLRPGQVAVSHRIEGLRWLGGGCEIRGWAYLQKLDPRDGVVEILLRGSDGSERSVRAVDRPEASFAPPYEDGLVDYDSGTFSVVFPVDELLEDASPGSTWTVFVRVSSGELAACAPVSQVLRNGSAGLLPVRAAGSGRMVGVDVRRHHPLQVRVEGTRLAVDVLTREANRMTGRISGPAAARMTDMVAARGSDEVVAELGADGDFTVAIPPDEEGAWTLRAIRRDGTRMRVTVAEPSWQDRQPDESSNLALRRTRRNLLTLEHSPLGAVAEHTEVDSGGLRITGRSWGPVSRVHLLLGGTPGPTVDVSGGEFTATHVLHRDPVNGRRPTLPAGDHDVSAVLHTPSGQIELPLLAGDRLSASIPTPFSTADVEGRLVVAPGRQVRVVLNRPLGRFRSRHAQSVLRATPAGPLVEGILLRSENGSSASGGVLDLHRELRERDPLVSIWWGVHDLSVVVPADAEPVVVNSPAWHELLGTARWYADDGVQPVHHVKGAGQVVVRASAPRPDEGRTAWTGQGLPPGRIATLLARAAEWDVVLAADAGVEEVLRDEFDYDGPVCTTVVELVEWLLRSRRP